MTNAFAAQEAVSRTAGQVDALFYFIAGVSLFFFLLVEGLLIYFAVKYRRRRGEEAVATSDVHGNVALETVWIVIPSIVVVVFFYYGYMVFRDMHAPLPGASDIHVNARQFLFQIRYPDGRTGINELRVPVGKPVKLILSSEDVIHSFFIPAFRIKQDMVPGRYTYLWLEPTKPGTYDIYCAEYCGVGHSTMRATLVVMPEAEYAAWAAGEEVEAVPLAGRGKELVERYGCLACHSLDGTAKVGPTFQGLYGRTVALEDGRTLPADEEYLRESIVDPGAKLVKGFPNVMPTFKTILSADDIAAIVAYLKSLAKDGEEREEARREGAAPPSAARGGEIAERYGCLGCHSTDGSAKVGPTFKGLFGREVPLADGRTVTADEAYLRESVYDPGAKIVKGFPPAMPGFRGTLSEEDLAAIVAYIRTLR
jgi:cytochrome c oxidase subunit II